MTVQEIIDGLKDQALDKDRLAGGDPDDIFTYDAAVLMEAARLLKELEAVNAPLTLEELREMDEEPIWATQTDGANGLWMFVDAKCRICRNVYGCRLAFEDCGKTWLAYRRKPEEVQ